MSSVTPTVRARRTMGIVAQYPKLLIGVSILVPIGLLSLLGPYVIPMSPLEVNPAARYAAPSLAHPMGTDHMGRDLFARVVLGGRSTILLGIGATAIALVFGVSIGIISAYMGGWIDEIMMRIMDGLMSIPTLIFGLLILTVLSSNLVNAMAAVGIVYTPRVARVVRSSTLSVKEEEFVQNAISRGESSWYIMGKEIFPAIRSVVVVEGTFYVGLAILIGTSLSFLGLGAQPPTPDWGYMIDVAMDHMWSSPWQLLFPALALSLTIIGFNLLGDGLRDYLDPRDAGH